MKFFIIVLIIGYVIFKGSGLIMKMLFGASQRSASRNFNNEYDRKQRTSGNVDLNYDPGAKSKKGDSNFKGGEYVDFEEID